MSSAIELFNAAFRDDPYALISQFKIKIKDSSHLAAFDCFWEEQIKIIDLILSGESLVILKPRQIGSTTACIAALFFLTFLAEDPITTVILSFKRESSRELLNQAKTFYNGLPAFIKKMRPAKITANEIIFEDSGARIILKGAKDEEGTRSFSYNYLIMSEFSFMKNAHDLLSAVKPSLGKGQIILESTASHFGDPLHQIINQTVKGETGYKFLFFDWTRHQKYQLPAPKDFKLSPQDIKDNLTPDQAFWRKQTIASLMGDEVKFKREFPRSLEEAYSQLQGSYIQDEFLLKLNQLKTYENRVIKFQQPQSNTKYTIGVDTAEGTGNDFSSVHVLNARTLEIAAVYRSNSITLTNLATLIADLSHTYGINSINKKALVNIESNAKGSVVITELHRLSIPIYYIDNKPWDTNKKTRPLLYEIVRDSIINSKLKEVDDYTYTDLRSIRQDNYGRFSHSDAIISLGLAIIAANSVSLPTIQPDFPHIKINKR